MYRENKNSIKSYFSNNTSRKTNPYFCRQTESLCLTLVSPISLGQSGILSYRIIWRFSGNIFRPSYMFSRKKISVHNFLGSFHNANWFLNNSRISAMESMRRLIELPPSPLYDCVKIKTWTVAYLYCLKRLVSFTTDFLWNLWKYVSTLTTLCGRIGWVFIFHFFIRIVFILTTSIDISFYGCFSYYDVGYPIKLLSFKAFCTSYDLLKTSVNS